ncbi:type VI secretion system protein TssA [Mesorhizobium shangrilense]|uniref:Type VI secretion system protein TssA n=1 Tax=Mesorhizobium shangrilense TaxID=460060 RepID=A0ABV2DBE0_9HYPH
MTAQIVDVGGLLKPISEDAPAGTDPRADTSSSSLYYRTKDARNAARSAERASVEIGSPPPEEWDVVLETAMEILAGHAKDLEVASWLVEALVRRHGFEGLRDGLNVLSGIASNFWDSCFPELDEDGVEGKVSSVAGLSGSGAVGTLIQPVRLTPLTHGSMASFSLWSYEQATELEKITDPNRKNARIEAGSVTMEQFVQSVAETPPDEFHQKVEVVGESLRALKTMSDAFDAVAGSDSPPISGLRELLEQINSSIRHFAAGKLAAVYAASSEEEAGLTETVTTDGIVSVAPARRTEGYSGREEALAELVKIATYFRKTEPHSPISYTLEEAVRRARMTLPELLSELAEDPAHIQRILMAAGIRNVEAAA